MSPVLAALSYWQVVLIVLSPGIVAIVVMAVRAGIKRRNARKNRAQPDSQAPGTASPEGSVDTDPS